MGKQEKEPKTKQPTFRHLVALIFFLVSQFSYAEWPPISDDPERLRFLYSLYRQMPQIITEMTIHETDLMAILEKQHELLQRIEADRRLSDLANRSAPFLQITVNPLEGSRTFTILDPQALADWREKLTETLGSVSQGNIQEGIVSEFRRAHSELGNRRSSGILTGMIQTLPPAIRAEAFRLPLEQQLRFLERNLPPEIIGAGFRAANHGLTQTSLTPSQGVRLLRDTIQLESRIQLLAQLAILGHREGAFRSRDELRTHISNLSESELDLFLDKTIFKNRFSEFISSLQQPISNQQQRFYQDTIRGYVQGVASRQTEIQSSERGRIHLVDVPPWLGIFRGCVGNDCSTSGSFPYPNSKHERIFFVRDDAGHIRGYVGATIVQTGSQNVLYVHTINGPRLSVSHVAQIIEGLAAARESIGVTGIVLPSEGRLDGNINFEHIRSALRTYLSGGRSVRLQYPDARLRSVLDELAGHEYDRAETNSSGIQLNLSSISQRTTSIEPYVPDIGPQHNLSKGQALLLALSTRNEELSARIIQAAGLSDNLLERMRSIVSNEAGASVEDYRRRITNAFQKLALTVDEPFWRDNAALFREPLLRTGNAFSDTHREHSLRSLINYLENDPDVDFLRTLVESNRDTVTHSAELTDYIARLIQRSQTQNVDDAIEVLVKLRLHLRELVQAKIRTKNLDESLALALAETLSPHTNRSDETFFLTALQTAIKHHFEGQFLSQYLKRDGVVRSILLGRRGFSKHLQKTLIDYFSLNPPEAVHRILIEKIFESPMEIFARHPGLEAGIINYLSSHSDVSGSATVLRSPWFQEQHPQLWERLATHHLIEDGLNAPLQVENSREMDLLRRWVQEHWSKREHDVYEFVKKHFPEAIRRESHQVSIIWERVPSEYRFLQEVGRENKTGSSAESVGEV